VSQRRTIGTTIFRHTQALLQQQARGRNYTQPCCCRGQAPPKTSTREADLAAAESAIIDYGNTLRDLAASNVFPGDLLLKNFGVTSHGRVIFYDYDEICLVSDCVFRDLPQASGEEEETSAEPWFHCGTHDVFPEQWLPFLSIPPTLIAVFKQHHAELLTVAWWREQQTSRELQ
jgi:isocitrate dehydrogenase kinase/phosphatase